MGPPHYLNKVRLSGSRRLNGKVMLHYFIKNIILLLLSFYAILRITHLLVGLNYLDNNLHLCINLISISLFLYYIIRYLEFSYTLITPEQITESSKVFAQLGLLLIFMYFALIVFFSNTTTIYCSSSEDYSEFDNYQVNEDPHSKE